MKAAARVANLIRAATVHIGDRFRVRMNSGAVVEVKILERLQSCTWMVENEATGKQAIVVLADLIEPVRIGQLPSVMDVRRRQANDVEADELLR